MTIRAFILTAILSTLSLFSAGRAQERSAVPPDTRITLQRFANAFGGGANYGLTISSDGTVVFERFANPSLDVSDPRARAAKPVRTNIPVEKVLKLVSEFERIKYFSLKDSYAKEEDGCPGVWTDQGGANISITLNGKTKAIAHYHGCSYEALGRAYPAELTSLEDEIDEVVGTSRWLK